MSESEEMKRERRERSLQKRVVSFFQRRLEELQSHVWQVSTERDTSPRLFWILFQLIKKMEKLQEEMRLTYRQRAGNTAYAEHEGRFSVYVTPPMKPARVLNPKLTPSDIPEALHDLVVFEARPKSGLTEEEWALLEEAGLLRIVENPQRVSVKNSPIQLPSVEHSLAVIEEDDDNDQDSEAA
jgi:hypothetical protein